MSPHISYLICATHRTGSTLLCEALTNTGLAGHPDEFFWTDNEYVALPNSGLMDSVESK